MLFYLLTAKPPFLRCSLWSWPERSKHQASAQQISVGSWAVGRWLPVAVAISERRHVYAQWFPAADQTALRVWSKAAGLVQAAPLPEYAVYRTHRLGWSAGTRPAVQPVGFG